jgi:hypothetical protein
MAGIKITDLSALTVAEATDYLCIVDVSDTSQSPAGTTKKIELENVATSGTWTPTLDGADDACSNPTLTKAQYSRVGNILTCTISGTVDFDFTLLTSGYFNFTYPFAPSNNNSIGTCGVGSIIGRLSSIVYQNKIEFTSDSSSTYSGVVFTAIFQYEID